MGDNAGNRCYKGCVLKGQMFEFHIQYRCFQVPLVFLQDALGRIGERGIGIGNAVIGDAPRFFKIIALAGIVPQCLIECFLYLPDIKSRNCLIGGHRVALFDADPGKFAGGLELEFRGLIRFCFS